MELWKIIVALILIFILGFLLGVKLFAWLLVFNAHQRLSSDQLKVFLIYLLVVLNK